MIPLQQVFFLYIFSFLPSFFKQQLQNRKMPRFFPLATGLAVASAITYKFKNDLLQDQNDIKTRLEDAKSTLDKAVIEPTFGSSRSYLSDSQKYVSNRLVPSGKRVLLLLERERKRERERLIQCV